MSQPGPIAAGCPNAQQLAAFCHGHLCEDSLREIAEHLGGCQGCELLLASLPPLFAESVRLDAPASDFEQEAEARRMIEAAKAIRSTAGQAAVSAENTAAESSVRLALQSASTHTELDATTGAFVSGTQTRHHGRDLPEGLGRYEIDAVLGEGAFGKVFRAYDSELRRPVAIKVSHTRQEAGVQESLLDEARLAAQVRHPGIVTIYDVGRTADGSVFIAMEYVDGHTLREMLAWGRLPVDRAVEIIEQAAQAVHHAHKKGLVHRDLKPGNLLIDRDGQVRVTDFGLALAEEGQRERAGEFAGTPAYMAPEQVRREAHRLDGRTDVWGLGVMLYEMLTQRRPFNGPKPELLDEIVSRQPKPPRQYDDRIPAEVERACLKCLEKQVIRRYSTAIDLANDLRRWRSSRSARPIGRWPLAAAAVGCLLALPFVVRFYLPSSGGAAPAAAPLGGGLEAGSLVDASQRLFEWQPLLSRPPRPLFPQVDIQERWVYNEGRKDVLMDSGSSLFLETGETKAKRYKLNVDISKSAPAGAAGLFFGFQSAPPRTNRPTWKCQTVCVNCRLDSVRVDYEVLELEEFPGGHSFAVRGQMIKAVRIPRPDQRIPLTPRNAMLELTIEGDRLHEVRWQKEPLEGFGARAKEAQATCTGKFGLVNSTGSTVFRDANFMQLWRTD